MQKKFNRAFIFSLLPRSIPGNVDSLHFRLAISTCDARFLDEASADGRNDGNRGDADPLADADDVAGIGEPGKQHQEVGVGPARGEVEKPLPLRSRRNAKKVRQERTIVKSLVPFREMALTKTDILKRSLSIPRNGTDFNFFPGN